MKYSQQILYKFTWSVHRYNNTQPGYPGYSGYNNTKPGFGVYNPRDNLSQPYNYEKGVCYIEVP